MSLLGAIAKALGLKEGGLVAPGMMVPGDGVPLPSDAFAPERAVHLEGWANGQKLLDEWIQDPRAAYAAVFALLGQRANANTVIRASKFQYGAPYYLLGQWISSAKGWCHQGGPWTANLRDCTGVTPPTPSYPAYVPRYGSAAAVHGRVGTGDVLLEPVFQYGNYAAVQPMRHPFKLSASHWEYLLETWITNQGPAHWSPSTGWHDKEGICNFLKVGNLGNVRVWRRLGTKGAPELLGVDKPYNWLASLCHVETLSPRYGSAAAVHGPTLAAPSYPPGWQFNRFAPDAGPGYHYNVPGLPVPASPSQLPPPPTPSTCPPGMQWVPAGVYTNPKSGWETGGTLDYWEHKTEYFPGGCCYGNDPFPWGQCVPPSYVPPVYNPCKPGWNYNAQAKQCCPPGWKWDPYTEQCVKK